MRCRPGGHSERAGVGECATHPARTTTSASGFPTGKVTLTLATEDTSTLTPALVKGFEKLHPNVTIQTQITSYTDYTAKIALELASSTPPDLSETVTLETPVKDHLLLNLNPYAAQYGWTKSISPYALAEYRMGSNLVVGSGPLYAVSSGFALTGLFYNKKLMNKLGIAAAAGDARPARGRPCQGQGGRRHRSRDRGRGRSRRVPRPTGRRRLRAADPRQQLDLRCEGLELQPRRGQHGRRTSWSPGRRTVTSTATRMPTL